MQHAEFQGILLDFYKDGNVYPDIFSVQCASLSRAARMGHRKFKVADEKSSNKLFDEPYRYVLCKSLCSCVCVHAYELAPVALSLFGHLLQCIWSRVSVSI